VLVLDASVVVRQCMVSDAFSPFGSEDLVAPPIMWSEARSTLHELRWRGAISTDLSFRAFDALLQAPIESRSPRALGRESWRVADELGWAKTYDAEYVALARILGCRMVTVEMRLHRAAARLGFVVSPTEL
jgi:predicted nucleic acid-binding protein